MPEGKLPGRRVLVVEDEYFLAKEAKSGLLAAGAVVLGPVPSVEMALCLLAVDAAPEAAVLDVNLGGEMAYPVADAMVARGIPFVFTTGYEGSDIPSAYTGIPRLRKPIDLNQLVGTIGTLLGGAA